MSSTFEKKPRFDKTAREAALAVERLQRQEADAIARQEAYRIALDHIDQGVRGYFALRHPNASTLIAVLDHVRLAYKKVKDERGINDEPWENPGYGQE